MKPWKLKRDAILAEVRRLNCHHEGEYLAGHLHTAEILVCNDGHRLSFNIKVCVYMCPKCGGFRMFGIGQNNAPCFQRDKEYWIHYNNRTKQYDYGHGIEPVSEDFT